jgi:phosphate-selective porin OprO/OprP
MKKTLYFASLALALASLSLHADDAPLAVADTKPASLDDLDQRVRILERQLEIEKEDAAAKQGSAVSLNSDPGAGFGFYNQDKTWGLKFSGVFQEDSRNYFDDPWGAPSSLRQPANVILPRRARLQLDAQLGPQVKLRYQQELFPTAGTNSVVDAFGEIKVAPWTTLRLGLQKTPLSLERWRSDPARDFVELGYTASLVTDRDTGAWLEVSDPSQVFLVGGGVFNGSPDTGNIVITDTDSEKDAVAKVFFHPFRLIDALALQNFGIGVAGSAGNRIAAVSSPSYKSVGQDAVTIYSYNANVVVEGAGYRIVPQAYWFYDSLSFLGEYVQDSQNVQAPNAGVNDVNQAQLNQTAWQAQLGWVLTGEDAAFTGLKLNKNSYSWGALQLVGRYEGLSFDQAGFNQLGAANNTVVSTRFVDPSKSVSSLQSYGAGLNYVPFNNTKFLLNYEETQYQGGNTVRVNGINTISNRPTERVLFARAQFSY